MIDSATKELYRMMQQSFYDEMKDHFHSLRGNYGYYSPQQKLYAIQLIGQFGVRATARILIIPRRTLQRWCRKFNVVVKRCPDWVYYWAERRQRKRRFGERKGYFY